MGVGITVACKTYGWEDQFLVGTGLLSYDNPEDYESIVSGELGLLAKRALDGLGPEKVHTLSELTCFSCPNCGKAVHGRMVTVFIDDDLPVVLHDCQNTCPACGGSMIWRFSGLREADITEYVGDLLKQGCPQCGGELVSYHLNWD